MATSRAGRSPGNSTPEKDAVRTDTYALGTGVEPPWRRDSRFLSIAENSRLAILILDSALRIVYANETAAQLSGHPRDRLVGLGFLQFVAVKSLPLVKYYDRCRQLGDYAPSSYEFTFIRKGGEERLVECTTEMVRDSPGRPETIIQLMDTTEHLKTEEELKRSHEIFKIIFEYAPDAIYLNDLRGNFIDGNRMVETLTGFSKEELIGTNILTGELLPTGQVPWAASLIAKNLSGKPSGPDELVLQRKDGVRVPVEISTYPVRFRGKMLVLGIARDISVRKRGEEELSRHREGLETLVRERTKELEGAKQAADAASRAKSTFVAHMSHEIRTPINAIMGFSQLMQRDEKLSPTQKRHLAVINRSGEHLLALITDILEMSKIEAGRTALNPTTFSLVALLDDLEMMFRMRTDAKRLAFAMEGLRDIPQYVEGDEGKLRQILINLLGNAVKFTETGGIVLRVRTRPEDDGKIRLEAEVDDTGPGIPEEEQGDLFKPFQQTQSGRRAMTGTGLGLAICKEFVSLMGGGISIVSRPGKGSLFKFHVLLKEGDVGLVEKKQDTRRVKCLRAGQPVYRILIADDEELSCSFLARLLGDVGFETRHVANGREAVNKFLAWRPHLILMDMRMPVMDGCEAARRVRAAEGGAEVKIISVSASAFEENRREALDAGADDFLTKPFRELVLFEKIEKLLGVTYELTAIAASEMDQAGGPGAVQLTAEAVAALPETVLKKMRESVIQADYDLMMGLIDGIDRRQASLADGLRGLVERFEYNRLLNLLQAKRRDQ